MIIGWIPYLIWFLFAVLFAGFFYLDTQKDTSSVTIAIIAILTAVSAVGTIGFARLRDRISVQDGTLKRYGKKASLNFSSILLLVVGGYHLLSLFLPAVSPNHIIKALLFGFIFIFSGIQNRTRWYIEIKDKYIIKNKINHFKIDAIESLAFTNDTIVLKNAKKTMIIGLNELTSEEQGALTNELREVEKRVYVSKKMNQNIMNSLQELNGQSIDKIYQVDYNNNRHSDIYAPFLFFITFLNFGKFLEIEGDFDGEHIKISLLDSSELDNKLAENHFPDEPDLWHVYDTDPSETLGLLLGQKIEFIEYGIDKDEFEINGIQIKGEKNVFKFISFNCKNIKVTIAEALEDGASTGLCVSDAPELKLNIEGTFDKYDTK